MSASAVSLSKSPDIMLNKAKVCINEPADCAIN